MKLAAKALRVSQPTASDLKKIKRRDIYIICDNVLDTYNIGSIFRLADAVAAKCVYLCGQTEMPPNSRIAKAAVGTDKWVPWQYRATAVEAIKDLRGKFSTLRLRSGSNNKFPIRHSRESENQILDQVEDDREKGIKVVAIEQSPKSVDFRKAKYELPIAFIVGNETDGVSREALALADAIVEIPMFGVNRSLNVMVSLAIVLYRVV